MYDKNGPLKKALFEWRKILWARIRDSSAPKEPWLTIYDFDEREYRKSYLEMIYRHSEYWRDCPSCEKRSSLPSHPCPYSEEMSEGEDETLCNCCDDCQSECAMDI